MFVIDKDLKNADKNDIALMQGRLNGQYLDVISDLLLLSYTKTDMQDLVSVRNADKEEFLDRAEKISPLNYAGGCYEAYLDIYEKQWQYLCFIEDVASGYESIAFHKDDILAIGIAGSDKSVEDWIDNDARLLIPRGPLVPTQFKIVGQKIMEIIDAYKKQNENNLPVEIIITGNSLGGAVTVAGYSEIFLFALANNIRISALTYNSAPLRLEFIEELLNEKLKDNDIPVNEELISKYHDGIMNLINEDDLLNNILYIFIRNIENFGHIGKYLIIENKGQLKDKELIHYAMEHVNVAPIRDMTIAKVQQVEYHSRNMIDDSAKIIRQSIKEKVDNRILQYKEAVLLLDKIRGAMIGTAVADYHGNMMLELTDATKLTLSVARGIIRNSEEPLPEIGLEIIEWQALDGKYIGKTTSTAIEHALKTGSFPTGAQKAHEILDGRTAGNCSLKRCLPVPLVYKDLEIVVTLSGLQSNMTHFDSRVKEACQLYSWLVFELLDGKTRIDALEEVFGSHLYYGQYKKMKVEELSAGAYVAESLLAALTLFSFSDTFGTLLEHIDNNPGLREAASIAGGLKGLEIGYKNMDYNSHNDEIDKLEILKIAGKIFDERMKDI